MHVLTCDVIMSGLPGHCITVGRHNIISFDTTGVLGWYTILGSGNVTGPPQPNL